MLWQIVITLSTAPPPFKPLSCHTIGLHLSEKVQKMRRRVAEKPNHFSETTASQIQIPSTIYFPYRPRFLCVILI